MPSPKWELVCEEASERTEKMKVQSGYIFRSTMWDLASDDTYIDGTTTQSTVFVPHFPIKVKTG